jgi:hypothetical protein
MTDNYQFMICQLNCFPTLVLEDIFYNVVPIVMIINSFIWYSIYFAGVWCQGMQWMKLFPTFHLEEFVKNLKVWFDVIHQWLYLGLCFCFLIINSIFTYCCLFIFSDSTWISFYTLFAQVDFRNPVYLRHLIFWYLTICSILLQLFLCVS